MVVVSRAKAQFGVDSYPMVKDLRVIVDWYSNLVSNYRSEFLFQN